MTCLERQTCDRQTQISETSRPISRFVRDSGTWVEFAETSRFFRGPFTTPNKGSWKFSRKNFSKNLRTHLWDQPQQFHYKTRHASSWSSSQGSLFASVCLTPTLHALKPQKYPAGVCLEQLRTTLVINTNQHHACNKSYWKYILLSLQIHRLLYKTHISQTNPSV